MSLGRLLSWQVKLQFAALLRGRGAGFGQRFFFGVLGFGWLLSVGFGVHAVLGETLRRSPDATWVPGLFLHLAWLGSLAMTLFFNLGLLLHVVFFSRDLVLLMASPISPRKVLIVRFVEAMWTNAFFSLFLSLPAAVAVGIHLGAGPLYAVTYAVVFCGFLVIPVALTYLVGIPLARWVPMSRLRALFSITGFLLAMMLWSLPHFLPGRIQSYREWAALLERAEALNGFFMSAAGQFLPSTWASRAMVAALEGRSGAAALDIGVLVGAGLGLAAVAVTLGARSYLDGWIRLATVSENRVMRGEKFTFLLRVLPSRWRPVFWKDMTTVARDFRLSFQLYSLGILMCLFPFVSLMSQGTEDLVEGGRMLVAFASAIGSSVVVASQAGMMTVPLEGKAGFRLLAAPLTALEISVTKWLAALLLSLPIVAAQIVVIRLGFQQSASESLLGGVLALAGALAGSGFGVFMGATFANYEWDHPKRMVHSGAQIAWGAGVGVIVVFLAVVVQLAMIVGESTSRDLAEPLYPILILAVGLVTSAAGVALAARRFRRMEWIQ